MAQPVNLNRFRKQKAQAEGQEKAERNVVQFGRSKAQKQQDKSENAKAKRALDGHGKER